MAQMKNKPMTKSHSSKAQQELRQERRSDLQSQLKSLSTKANARLASLEKHGLTSASNAYRYLEKRHFDKDTMLYESRSGKIRFTTKVGGRTSQQLQHQVRELERFLYESKTSTVSGVKARYTQSFETYANHFASRHEGAQLSREQFDAIVNAEGFAAYVKAFGSSQIDQLLEAMDDPGFDVVGALEDFEPGMTESEFWEDAQVPGWIMGNNDDYDFSPFDR